MRDKSVVLNSDGKATCSLHIRKSNKVPGSAKSVKELPGAKQMMHGKAWKETRFQDVYTRIIGWSVLKNTFHFQQKEKS
mgnify:CR=1 FL=1